MNIESAHQILEVLSERGCEEVVLCSGARNAPFVEILSRQESFKVTTHFDERGASFYALGRVRDSKKPVAVLTTSGTAVAECLPAVIEAYYQEQSLIVLTSDRPKSLRGTGAPQTIDQSEILAGHCELAIDMNSGEKLSIENWSGRGPLHINVCFEEPLIDFDLKHLKKFKFEKQTFQRSIPPLSPSDREWLTQAFFSFKKPLILVSGLESERERRAIESLLRDFRGPCYIERTSGIQASKLNLAGQILGGDLALREYVLEGKVDGIVRFGSIPTVKLWRQLDELQIPVLSLSELPFSGLKSGTLIFGRLDHIVAEIKERFYNFDSSPEHLNRDRKHRQFVLESIEKYPLSEISMFHRLIVGSAEDELIYIGNSLPIRIWDFVAADLSKTRVIGNRGVNGIDGQIASALGTHSSDLQRLVIGDLTAKYDLNSLELVRNRKKPIQIIVVNNGGGQIFSRIFSNELYLNSHEFDFSKIAESYGFKYYKIQEAAFDLPPVDQHQIIEIFPSNEQTKEFWSSYEARFES